MVGGSRKRVYYYGKRPQSRAVLEAALRLRNTVVNCFSKGEDCLDKLSEKPCDLLIVDLDGCETEGLTVLTEARRMAPWILSLALVERAGVRSAVRAVKAGACDCLEKPIKEDRLLRTIEIQIGSTDTPASYARRPLTHTEIQVLQLILAGKTSRDIAMELHRSKRTIDVHRKNIMRKLQAGSTVDLIKRALGMGFADEQQSDDAVMERP